MEPKKIEYKGKILSAKCECYNCNPEKGKIKKTAKTHDQFVTEFFYKYPDCNITFLTHYIATKVFIICKCNECEYEWTSRPDRLLAGHYRCPKCIGKRKITHEEFVKKFNLLQPNSRIIFLSKYNGERTKIKCKCSVCGNIWETLPNTLLKLIGTGCKQCNINEKVRTEAIKDHEGFLKRYCELNPNSNITFLSKWNGQRKPIKCKCNICNYVWSPNPNALLQKRTCGCPSCANKIKKTHKQFEKEYYELFPDSNIIFQSLYNNASKKITCYCTQCNNLWDSTPNNLLRGYGCSKCAGVKLKTDSEFKSEFYKRNPYSDIEIRGEYTNSRNKILCYCKKCDKEFNAIAGQVLWDKISCPYHSNISKIEQLVINMLDQVGIKYKSQVSFDECKNIISLRFDFKITDIRFKTFLLECQGEQHEHPIDFAGKGEEWAKKQFDLNQKRDKIKVDFCQETGKILEFIWYYEDTEEALINLLRKHIKPEYNMDEILNTTREQVA